MKNKQSSLVSLFTNNTSSAPLWFIVRLYVGYIWLMAGWEKIANPAWFGPNAGAALTGFAKGALAKTGGAHPDVTQWYAAFLQYIVLPNVTAWSNAIAVGELLVGLGLIVGIFTTTAAFFGFFMNLNFLFAGAVSSNPVLLVLSLLLMIAHRVAGHWGLDRFVRPILSRTFRRRNAIPAS